MTDNKTPAAPSTEPDRLIVAHAECDAFACHDPTCPYTHQPTYAAAPSTEVARGGEDWIREQVVRAKAAADAIGVTPHSVMRVFVERAVIYALGQYRQRATPASDVPPIASSGEDLREAFKAAMVDAARARGGFGAEFIAKGHTNLWLDIAYDAAALISAPAVQPVESGSLLRAPTKSAPAGCHCKDICWAPVIMGRQQPCRRAGGIPGQKAPEAPAVQPGGDLVVVPLPEGVWFGGAAFHNLKGQTFAPWPRKPNPKLQAVLAEALSRDRDASLAEDAQRLSPEGVAARAVTDGIAKDQGHD